MDYLVIAGDTAAAMILKVRASEVLLFGEMTKNSGSYTVRIDGGETESYSAKCNDGNMRLVQVIAGDLDPTREHTIEITPALRQNEELRFESVCVAGGEALVSKNAP